MATHIPVPVTQNYMNDTKEKQKQKQKEGEERICNSCKFCIYICITVTMCIYMIIIICASLIDFIDEDEWLDSVSSSSS
tara:strand:+ start:316 stop:552 length:237 start_codon:yes stop_codon:yes gene_type:complete